MIVPAIVPITIRYGADFNLTLKFYEDAAKTTALDLTGNSFDCRIIDDYNNPMTLATMTSDLIDASNGLSRHRLTEATINALTDDTGAGEDQEAPDFAKWYCNVVHGGSGSPTSWTVSGAHSAGATAITLTGGSGDFSKWAFVDFADGNDYEIDSWDSGTSVLTLSTGLVAALSGGEAASQTAQTYQYFIGSVALGRSTTA